MCLTERRDDVRVLRKLIFERFIKIDFIPKFIQLHIFVKFQIPKVLWVYSVDNISKKLLNVKVELW